MKKRGIVSFFILIFGFAALSLWLYTVVVKVGADLRPTSPYLEYGYYGVVLVFFFFFFLRPFFLVLLSPSFQMQPLRKVKKEDIVSVKEENYQNMRKMSQRLIQKKLVNTEHIEALKLQLRQPSPDFETRYQTMQDTIRNALDEDLKKDIRKIIITAARDTLYLTSLSQNKFVDVLVVIVNNFRLTKKIVVRCGFRPSYFKLVRFYINVAISSLIADGAQSIDLGSLLGSSIKGLTKPILGSLLDGTVNAFFMLRTGFLVRNFIFEDHRTEAKEIDLTRSALMEAVAAVPELTISTVIQPIVDVLKGTIITPTRDIFKKLFHDEGLEPSEE